MNSRFGLWIDHRRAFIIHFSGIEARTENIESNLEKHVRAAGGSRTATPYGPQDVFAEDKVDRKFQLHLKQFYNKVAESLQGADSILIMGPGEARNEFRKHLEKSKQQPRPAIEVAPADKMTDAQIVAKAREYFSLRERKATS